MKIHSLISDISLSAITAGFVAVLIGYASAWAIVYTAATAAGADQAMINSWIWALGISMGLGCLGLSLYYKRPIIIAWSTPGAALLASSLTGASIAEAIGIFVFVGALTLLTGLSGCFDALTRRVPMPIASAMLAGILVQFGLNTFLSLQAEPLMVGIMIITLLVVKRWLPRFAILAVLASAFMSAYVFDLVDLNQVQWSLSAPVWVTPNFNISLLIGVGLPLFIVTMTSQNMPGIAILRAANYNQTPTSPILSWTGLLNVIFAPFGAFSLNLAAITAAICASEEAHPDASKRYIAGVFAGIFNIIFGLFGATVVSLFAAFPTAMISALAGLALLSTISASLYASFREANYRDAALITFLVTASGVSFFNVASAFWGITIGLSTLLLSKKE
ncbi:benzoate/H(+) symporter BenE family transporter [Paraglaciecola sp. 2405UD69-4]|uniref:benzoate/H(+) symporter BenE family transporter n=1 Tax=Paraglaciecola sp. 2405UD69-4 TaxID=3391836 RepID=UPI0039C933D8